MREQEELTCAKEWVESFSEEEKKLLTAVSELLTQGLFYEGPLLTLVQKIGFESKKALGSFLSYLEEEKIKESIFDNVLLILFRFHRFFQSRFHSPLDVVDSILSGLDHVCFYFREFVDATLQKKKHISFSDADRENLSHSVVTFFLTIAFPEREKSFLLPLPSLAKRLVQPYLKKAYEELEIKGKSCILSFLNSSSGKSTLFSFFISFLQKKLCSWKGELSFVAYTQEKELEVRREKLERTIAEAVYCLTLEGDKLASLCPKYRVSCVLISMLDVFSKNFDKNMTIFFLHVTKGILQQTINIPVDQLEELEKRIFNKDHYAPLFYRLIRNSKSVPSFSQSPTFVKILFQGILTDLLSQSFDSIPWDDAFLFLSFSLRRTWYYVQSNEILVSVNCFLK